jgi:predicted metal-dependent hydrolase
MTLGTSRAGLLTAAGTAVDNRVAAWGRPREREIPLPGLTCSEDLEGACGQEKVTDVVSRPGAILRAMSTQKPPESSRPPVRPPVKVVRSSRRRKTVTAYRQGETVVVLLPARMSRREEDHWVATMLERLERRARRVAPGDDELERRARLLARRYLEGMVEPRSVRWVGNMRSRYGSCTPDDGTIRLSDRLAPWPPWVRDYVLVHELAHLAVPDHSPAFWRLVDRYPLSERARGFLIAKGMEEDDD